jgi:hypothetical protein
MRVVVVGVFALTGFLAGTSPTAAQVDNCVAFVGQFGSGSAAGSDALNGLCLSGDTLPVGNGMRLPFGFLPPNAALDGAAIVPCAIAAMEVAAHGSRPYWLEGRIPDALVSNPPANWGDLCRVR